MGTAIFLDCLLRVLLLSTYRELLTTLISLGLGTTGIGFPVILWQASELGLFHGRDGRAWGSTGFALLVLRCGMYSRALEILN